MNVRLAVVFFVCLSLCLSSVSSAGTTGGIIGTVVDSTSGAPVAGAHVTVTSASQTESATTDAAGRFAFVSLGPDTYTISAAKTGYQDVSLAGVSVFADQQQTVVLRMLTALRTIANVTSRSAGDLVRPGTTADMYSVNAAQQARLSALGGGGDLNSAFSAIASVPGAYVPTNQAGYLQSVHVRGGDAYEVGYEFDGVPVNRSFDNYPSGSLTSLGQQELQVYTGATPANGEAQGLAGFVNQVIKTGTYPGFQNVDLAIGGPAFYHSAGIEIGGASPNHLFSYYAGFIGSNKDVRYIDQFDGQSYSSRFGPILGTCPSGPPPPDTGVFTSCYTNGQPNISTELGAAASSTGPTPGWILGPMPYGNYTTNLAQRDVVANVHFGIPHKHDTGRDDIQLLYDNGEIFTALYNSGQDMGIPANLNDPLFPVFNNAFLVPFYSDYYTYTGQTGTVLPANYGTLIHPYLFPSSPTNRPFGSEIPLNQRDIQYNEQAIVKLQYQKNFGADAYLRLYGYTYYSNYVGTGPVSTYEFTGFDAADYELSAHTRGVSATFAKQLGAQHLLQVQGSYTTANAIRVYNEQSYGAFGASFNPEDNFAVLLNPNDTTHGICYAVPASGTVATPTTCNNGYLNTGTQLPAPTYASLGSQTAPGCGSSLSLTQCASQYTCGAAPCQFFVTGNGQFGEFNNVKPYFTGFSITDQYRPNDRLLFNLGLRLDRYDFKGDATDTGPARTFWFDSFNNDTCFNTTTSMLVDKSTLLNASNGTPFSIGEPCGDAGANYVAANMQNASGQEFVYNVWQPRLGVTYTVNPDTVLRASFGRYNEQPTSAYEQYDSLQANLPATLAGFYALGFTTPGHDVRPPISYNSDLSIEHHFKGTAISLKLTPFYRQTKDEVENFYTSTKAGITSGLNAGSQTSEGFELALTDGNFDRNGFAGQFSFAYTNSYVKYSTLPNGQSVLTPINNDIAVYNAYTSACAGKTGKGICGLTNYINPGNAALPATGTSAACFTPSGVPDPSCATGDIGNPYWNAPAQPLLDVNGAYLPYSIIPGGLGTGVNAYNYPYVASLVLNYKHDKLSISPAFQFVAGNRYGAPETTPGIDPATGCSPLATQVPNDPRYPHGVPAGGLEYDAGTCGVVNNNLSTIVIPDPYTGQFDPIGAFRQPSQFLMHLRVSYDLSPQSTLTLTLANLISTCFGGQQTPFTYFSSRTVCSYTNLSNFATPAGNVYNPGDNVQPFLRYPYQPDFGTYNDQASSLGMPFSMYLTLHVKV
ncbi:MAG TPA: TonB-dependent receptor [Candidatus Baltobacteraceae bacterium]|jgi:hypothetical protein|nr:TonB-dependent receptor [Candidatus Baltobacteraceae bacterium]